MASVARGAAGKAQAAHGNLIPGNPKENGLRRSHVSRQSTQHYSVCDNTACSLSTHTVSLDDNPSFYPISLSCLCTHKTHRRLCKLKENKAVFLHSDRKKKRSWTFVLFPPRSFTHAGTGREENKIVIFPEVPAVLRGAGIFCFSVEP